MKTQMNKLVLLFSSIGFILGFQNCSSGFEMSGSSSLSATGLIFVDSTLLNLNVCSRLYYNVNLTEKT